MFRMLSVTMGRSTAPERGDRDSLFSLCGDKVVSLIRPIAGMPVLIKALICVFFFSFFWGGGETPHEFLIIRVTNSYSVFDMSSKCIEKYYCVALGVQINSGICWRWHMARQFWLLLCFQGRTQDTFRVRMAAQIWFLALKTGIRFLTSYLNSTKTQGNRFFHSTICHWMSFTSLAMWHMMLTSHSGCLLVWLSGCDCTFWSVR